MRDEQSTCLKEEAGKRGARKIIHPALTGLLTVYGKFLKIVFVKANAYLMWKIESCVQPMHVI